ncbi:MAG: Fis family transcriptional regulator [Nitrospirae bacterium GWC2_57_13]|jgi:two-component system, NtrC family, response regulator AtoC|nr:MAG: Fis family transcriptional regulator [Nitrospirae bacterium GWC2_57_13]OGW41478.1 MAG: Fis family transcriptional regulator [Nitrospirae bacterium GWD2_57_8]
MPQKILVIDDEKLIRWTLEQHLVKEGYEVATAESAERGMDLIADDAPDLILLDNRLPDMSGLEMLEKVKVRDRGLMVIMITAYGMVEAAVKAMKLGAYDYVSKPFNLEEITFVIKKALEAGSLRTQVKQLRQECKAKVGTLIGECVEMEKVKDLILKIARSDATTVLIQGDSGTGKELVAKAIHAASARVDKPFHAMNCAAVPETLLESELMGHEKGAFTDAKSAKKGLFELADSGTLFLDEIGDMDLSMQAKLLRILEEKTFKRVGGVKDIKVDVRVISASNQDLLKSMSDGTFRKDLFYRLQVVPVMLPPLRERGSDILLLANYFIDHFNRECHKSVSGISKEAEDVLLSYSWPGNVRELKNVIERAMILEVQDELLVEHLPQELLEEKETSASGIPVSLDGFVIPDQGISIEDVEHALVRKALEIAAGNQTKAASLLKMPRDAFRRRMKRFGII